jgi:hypothetical protein
MHFSILKTKSSPDNSLSKVSMDKEKFLIVNNLKLNNKLSFSLKSKKMPSKLKL